MKNQIQSVIDELESTPEQPVCSGQLAGFMRRLFRLQEKADAPAEQPVAEVSAKAEPAPAAPAADEVLMLKQQLKEWQKAYDALESGYSRAHAELQTLQASAAAHETEKRELESRIQAGVKDLEQAKQQLTAAQAAVTAAETKVETAAKECTAMQAALEDLRRRLEEADRTASSLRAEAETARAQTADAQKQAEKLKTDLNSARALTAYMWPDCLHIPALKRFEAVWNQDLVSGAADKGLLAMFGHIFCWSATVTNDGTGVPDNNTETMATTALYNFCRYLTDWMYRNGESAESVYGILMELAASVNAVLAGAVYEVELPMLDSPYSSKSMTPSASGQNTGSVVAIEAWGIKASNSAIYKKKTIVKLA